MSEDQLEQPEKSSHPARWLLALFAAGLALAMVAQLHAVGEREETLVPGEAAPDFAMPTHAGGTVTLEALRGQVILLDFWATWCPPCAEEMPSLVKLAREYERRGVKLIAASRDEPMTASAAVNAFDARRAPGVAGYTALASDDVATRYKAAVLPTLYVIGRSGKVTAVLTGFSPEETIREKIELALQGG